MNDTMEDNENLIWAFQKDSMNRITGNRFEYLYHLNSIFLSIWIGWYTNLLQQLKTNGNMHGNHWIVNENKIDNYRCDNFWQKFHIHGGAQSKSVAIKTGISVTVNIVNNIWWIAHNKMNGFTSTITQQQRKFKKNR